MKNALRTRVPFLIYEGPGARALPASDRFALVRTLLAAGHSVFCTAGEGRPPSAALEGGRLAVLGHFDGTPPLLEDSGGQVEIATCDLTGLDAPQALARAEEILRSWGAPIQHPGVSGSWKPWFPVIDYQRCTNCMQCLSFCLFDVYGVSEQGKIQVQNNDNCKTDCPACSRVCPEVAILFPKYKSGPINGDEVKEADLKREAIKVDISALLGGDIYHNLRDRSERAKQRFSKERDDKRALSERMRCLTKLAEQMDVPMELLTSLPSADQIREKTEKARARAQAALEGA